MKQLSQMTRDELWALDDEALLWLAIENKVTPKAEADGQTFDQYEMCNQLENRRLELQQDAAEARQER